MRESRKWAYTMAYVDPILGWMNGTLGFMVIMTLQLQFIIPQMLGEILVTFLTSSHFLSKKKGFGEPQCGRHCELDDVQCDLKMVNLAPV